MGDPKTGATGPVGAALDTLDVSSTTCRFDDFELDLDRLELKRSEQLVRADTLVLRVLALLLRHAGRLVTKDELVRHVWDGRVVADNAITVSISRLRKLLGDRAGRERVVSVYGRGYRFVGNVSFDSDRAPEQGLSLAPSSSSSLAVETDDDARTPFVGRDRAMSRLRRALSEARRGRGQGCVLLGEPGIGKTRVVEALARELSGSGVRVAWGYCREAGDTPPLWPFLRILRTVTETAFPNNLEQRLGSLASDVRSLLSGPAGAERSFDPMRADPLGFRSMARHRGLDAILRTLAVAAEQGPWVVVLEDLHRADAASLELLGLLLDELAHMRILVVATLRPKCAGRTQRSEQYLSEVVGHRNCERIALERLTAEDVGRYISALMKDPDGALATKVFAQSEGNPFFMAELARQLEAGGDSEGALAIPNSARDVVKQRLARLEPDARRTLSAAAVIGRTFELSVLSAVCGRDPSDLMATLDDAIATEVLVVAPESSTAFAFGHELLRSVLYDALSLTERRSWHLVVAHALETRLHAGYPVPPSELAFHCHAALPQGDLRRAVSYCRAAASASALSFANQDVVRYARHALEALDLMERPSIRLRLHLLLAIALYSRSYTSTEFIGLVNEVIRLATEHGDAFSLVRAACLLYPHPGFKPLPGSLPALERALGMLDDRHAGVRALAAAALACTAPHCYAADDNGALIGNALEPARESGLRGVLHGVLRCKLYLEGGPDHELQAERTAAELERLHAEDPAVMPALPAELAIHRAIVALQRGDAPRVSAQLERARARCREIVHTELLFHTERFAAIWRVNTGDISRGLSRLEAVHAEAAARQVVGFEPFRAFDRAVICDELAEGRVLCDADQRALIPDPADPPSVWSLKLRALATAGLSNEAIAALRTVPASDLARLPCDMDYLGTLGHVTRAALRLGARDYYETLYSLLSRYPEHYSGGVSLFSEGAVAQLCGMLAQELGQRAKAVTHFELAIRMNDRAGLEPRAAEARLQLSRCLLEQSKRGGKEHALTLAGDARVRATRLGIARLSHEASALRARAQSAHTI